MKQTGTIMVSRVNTLEMTFENFWTKSFTSTELYDKLFINFFGKTAEQQKEEEDLKLYGWAFKIDNIFDFELQSIGHKPLVLKTETKSTVANLLWMALVQIKSGSVPTKERV